MSVETQPTLFDVEDGHDYGGDFDGDFGHEFPFVRADKAIDRSEDTGVSVSLEDRRVALESLAHLYGRRARALELEKAVDTPDHREELQKRYRDVDAVSVGALKKSSYSPKEEALILRGLTKVDQLVAAGFDRADAELVEQSTITEARNAFGIDVGHVTRNKNLKIIKQHTKR